jgi:hypothetical protein
MAALKITADSRRFAGQPGTIGYLKVRARSRWPLFGSVGVRKILTNSWMRENAEGGLV